MKKRKFLRGLTTFELVLWLVSAVSVTGSFLLFGNTDYLLLATTLVGVTALILVAKGDVLGQLITIAFAVMYAIISYRMDYYGEMITYVGMSAPMAAFSVVSWLRHPYKKGGGESQVKVRSMRKKDIAPFVLITLAVTAAFYFILGALGTSSLIVSTVSVTTSFSAAYLLFMRSPFYAAAYACNDIVLIILWIIAALEDVTYVSMVVCFAMFLLNDAYALINWIRMLAYQQRHGAPESNLGKGRNC